MRSLHMPWLPLMLPGAWRRVRRVRLVILSCDLCCTAGAGSAFPGEFFSVGRPPTMPSPAKGSVTAKCAERGRLFCTALSFALAHPSQGNPNTWQR